MEDSGIAASFGEDDTACVRGGRIEFDDASEVATERRGIRAARGGQGRYARPRLNSSP